MPEQFPQRITQDTTIDFSVEKFGLYAISISARCKSAGQSESQQNETLRVEIDNIKLREVPQLDKPQYNKIPPAWNGTDQQGLSKTIIFIVTLNKSKHTLNFFPTNGALIEEWNCQIIENIQEVSLALEKQAENGDKRPWYTFSLVNVPLKSLISEVSVSWHLWDGDDVKLVIDGSIQENNSSKLWKYWLWSARPWQLLTGPKKEQKIIELDLTQAIHYIEFWADKTPTLHQIAFNLGDFQPKRIPTVNDPEWTGDFSDDIDQIILARALFGEARNTFVPDEARVAIGWVIRNRVASKSWPNTYWEVVTEPLQFSAFNLDDTNRVYVENPLHSGKEVDKVAWEHAYQISGKLIGDQISDPTYGANHYYDDSIRVPPWAKDKKPSFVGTYINKHGSEVNIFFFKL